MSIKSELIRQNRRLAQVNRDLDTIDPHAQPARYIDLARKRALIKSEIEGIHAFEHFANAPKYKETNRLDAFMAGFRVGMRQERIL